MRPGTSLLRICGATAVAFALSAPPSAVAAGGPPHGFFGVIPSGLTPADMSRMAANGVATVRMNIEWSRVEPQPGQRDWSFYDWYVGALAQSGIQAEPLLFGVPSWISAKPAKPPLFGAGQRLAWSSFLTDLAARYGHNGSFWRTHPGVPYRPLSEWEVWNEPNLKGDWGGRVSPRQYVRLLRLTRAALRRSDPQARIAVGGIFPPPRPRYGVSLKTFMQGIYRVHGARRAFDAVAIHPYASRPKGVLRATREARRILNGHKDRATPLWITELGWTTGGARWKQSPYRATESQQAKYLKQTFRRLIRFRRALRLKLLLWFAWQDTTLPGAPWTGFTGLTRSDGTAKPALNAYRQIALAG